jgi:hypothetical protein
MELAVRKKPSHECSGIAKSQIRLKRPSVRAAILLNKGREYKYFGVSSKHL